MEQELLTLPEQLSSTPVSSRALVARSLVFCVVFCKQFFFHFHFHFHFSFGHCTLTIFLLITLQYLLITLRYLQTFRKLYFSHCLRVCNKWVLIMQKQIFPAIPPSDGKLKDQLNSIRGLWSFVSFRTRVRIFIFLVAHFVRFNFRLYDKNSESDYFFFLHQNQNIFFNNIGNQNIFFYIQFYPCSSLDGGCGVCVCPLTD